MNKEHKRNDSNKVFIEKDDVVSDDAESPEKSKINSIEKISPTNKSSDSSILKNRTPKIAELR